MTIASFTINNQCKYVYLGQTKLICCFTDPAGEFPRDAKIKVKMGVVNINGRGFTKMGRGCHMAFWRLRLRWLDG